MIKRYEWELYPKKDRKFGISFSWFGFYAIQLGFHISLAMKNIEIHLPFCFIRIGLLSQYDKVVQIR
jgi:hypothetical protein